MSYPIQRCDPQHAVFKYLLETSDPPKRLFLRGNFPRRPMIAVVGGRRASAYGLGLAFRFSAELAEAGYGVVSGLARGIDAASHCGALSAGGYTAAILGHGLDRIYPREHQRLAHRILESGGALISEYPAGTAPNKWHFPQRNRIISGLCLGTLVIQARAQSGSLITARLAVEENREVFVVPGSAQDPSFEGSHELIQSGAKLVRSVGDILEELPPLSDGQGVKVAEAPRAQSPHACPTYTLDDCLNSGTSRYGLSLRQLFDSVITGQAIEVAPRRYVIRPKSGSGREK